MKRRNDPDTTRFWGSHWFLMKIGSTPMRRAAVMSFATRWTAGAIMSMLLPMRSNRPFGEQKSCWRSIIRRAVWLGSTTSSMVENTSLPSAVIIAISLAKVDLAGDFAIETIARLLEGIGGELPIDRQQLARRRNAGSRSDLQMGRRRKELLHPNRLEIRREALFDEGIGEFGCRRVLHLRNPLRHREHAFLGCRQPEGDAAGAPRIDVSGIEARGHARLALLHQDGGLNRLDVQIEDVRLERLELLECRVEVVLGLLDRLAGLEMRGDGRGERCGGRLIGRNEHTRFVPRIPHLFPRRQTLRKLLLVVADRQRRPHVVDPHAIAQDGGRRKLAHRRYTRRLQLFQQILVRRHVKDRVIHQDDRENLLVAVCLLLLKVRKRLGPVKHNLALVFRLERRDDRPLGRFRLTEGSANNQFARLRTDNGRCANDSCQSGCSRRLQYCSAGEICTHAWVQSVVTDFHNGVCKQRAVSPRSCELPVRRRPPELSERDSRRKSRRSKVLAKSTPAHRPRPDRGMREGASDPINFCIQYWHKVRFLLTHLAFKIELAGLHSRAEGRPSSPQRRHCGPIKDVRSDFIDTDETKRHAADKVAIRPSQLVPSGREQGARDDRPWRHRIRYADPRSGPEPKVEDLANSAPRSAQDSGIGRPGGYPTKPGSARRIDRSPRGQGAVRNRSRN